MVSLHPVGDDVEYVEHCLEAAELPTRDLETTPADLYHATVGGERIGVGGIETYGTVGLLRSVVVESDRRGQGYGSALCEALERTARADGVERLYLLTTTAAEFFAARGYGTVEREAVPSDIRRTTQFEDICPSSATCMRKSL